MPAGEGLGYPPDRIAAGFLQALEDELVAVEPFDVAAVLALIEHGGCLVFETARAPALRPGLVERAAGVDVQLEDAVGAALRDDLVALSIEDRANRLLRLCEPGRANQQPIA